MSSCRPQPWDSAAVNSAPMLIKKKHKCHRAAKSSNQTLLRISRFLGLKECLELMLSQRAFIEACMVFAFFLPGELTEWLKTLLFANTVNVNYA